MTFGGKAWRCIPFKKALKVMTLGDKAWRCFILNKPFKVITLGGKARSRVSLRPWILGAVALFLGLWRCIPFKKKALKKRETDDVGWQVLALHPAKSSKMRSNPNGYGVWGGIKG